MSNTRIYVPVKKRPIAKFFYRGNHSHPVRRTVVVTEMTDEMLTGYELREGRQVRAVAEAPLKSFRRDRIAKIQQLDRRRKLRRQTAPEEQSKTTLKRESLMDLLGHGA